MTAVKCVAFKTVEQNQSSFTTNESPTLVANTGNFCALEPLIMFVFQRNGRSHQRMLPAAWFGQLQAV
jgi:hypothetical protein